MNILIYGKKDENDLLLQMIKTQTNLAFRTIIDFQTEDYDKLLEYLRTVECDMIIVQMDHAAGMEGAIAALNVCPDKPVLWFSNDKNFVAQSYRLGVTYFSVKPIHEKMLNLAIARCQSVFPL